MPDRRQNRGAHPQDARCFAEEALPTLRRSVAELAGAVVLRGLDGNLRDLAAMSSHYRRVHQTGPALTLIGSWLATHGAASVTWYLDAPVSGSGRLAGRILEIADQNGWAWQAELVPSPDPVLAITQRLIATADGGILDRGGPWLALARHVVEASVLDAWLIDLNQ